MAATAGPSIDANSEELSTFIQDTKLYVLRLITNGIQAQDAEKYKQEAINDLLVNMYESKTEPTNYNTETLRLRSLFGIFENDVCKLNSDDMSYVLKPFSPLEDEQMFIKKVENEKEFIADLNDHLKEGN